MRATAQVTQTQSTNDCAGCPTATPTWSSIYRYLQWIRVMSVTGKVPTGQRHVSQKTTECNYAQRKNIPEVIGLSKEPCFSGIFEIDGRFFVFPKCQGILRSWSNYPCLFIAKIRVANSGRQDAARADESSRSRTSAKTADWFLGWTYVPWGDEWDILPAGQSHLEGYIQVHKPKLRVISLHWSQHFPIISYGHRVIIPHFPIIIP